MIALYSEILWFVDTSLFITVEQERLGLFSA